MMIVNDQNEELVEEKQQEKSENVEVNVSAEEVKEVVEEVAEVVTEEVVEAAPVVEEVKEISEEEQMIEMIDDSFANIQVGKIVDGTILSINDQEVMVDIGYKSEGAVPVSEFANCHTPEVNSVIKVFINAIEDGAGKLKLSKKRADFFINQRKLEEASKTNETVRGKLVRRVKGGMIAQIYGLEAFLPGSQIALKPIPNLDQFIGKECEFKIIKLDIDRRNIIVSRKKVIEEELRARRDYLKEKITVGVELDGEVKNITDYGAFVDLGGIDGLLHITDMSWGHISHPSELLNIGDKLKVKVIDVDNENNRISLGLKQLVPHPWKNVEDKYQEGTKVSGKVVNIMNYGAFIELEPGVEGLVHISEMSWTKKITHPKQIVKIGTKIEAIVLNVSKEEQRISLGMKQMKANPWLTIDERYPMGSVVKRKIKNITPFGIFVEIEDNIDGLIHISDISWTKRIYHPREMFKKGQEVEAKLLSIDYPLHRIALGIKQLVEDPWENLDEKLPVNTEVVGTISKLIPKGVLVDIKVDEAIVEGFVPLSHLAIPKLHNPELAFKTSEELSLKVIELDMENRRLILSVKAFYFAQEREALEKYQQEKIEIIREREAMGKKPKAPKKEKKETEVVAKEAVDTKVTEEAPVVPVVEEQVAEVVAEPVEEAKEVVEEVKETE